MYIFKKNNERINLQKLNDIDNDFFGCIEIGITNIIRKSRSLFIRKL